jgi:Glycosyl hydrolases family 2, TIM barrel domain/Glycosyl hydrolases family 2/Glycosyl hydrolases family 2, sugar binding domain
MLRKAVLFFWLFLFLKITGLSQSSDISLAGTWRFAIDSSDAGIREQWFTRRLSASIQLPGSMNSNNLGMKVGIHTQWTASIYDSSFFFQTRFLKYRQPEDYRIPCWLTPLKYYCGPAWYQKEIVIPPSASVSHWQLMIERTHIASSVWLDGISLGEGMNSLAGPHIYQLPVIKPGKHLLTIRIDNRLQNAEVGQDSHSVSDHTQGNWNGMIGRIVLQPVPVLNIQQLQVYPVAAQKSIRVECLLKNNGTQPVQSYLRYQVKGDKGGVINREISKIQLNAGDTATIVQWISLGDDARLWDEFDPYLYQLQIKTNQESRTTSFGLRDVKVSGRTILVNNRPVFFRGNLNNCEFPLTGYPPMDTDSWLKLMRTLKEAGINHIRFHSWCPPEAAFAAADILGIYLQPEAPTWPNHGITLGDDRFIDQYIFTETNRMMEQYGNHPSFLMLAAGNEPAGKNQVTYLTRFIRYWKEKDPRRIYTGASVATSWPLVPENEYMVKSGARGLNWANTPPSSIDDYALTVEKYQVPFITHEQGQWCAFPDLSEISKYKGAYRARNFELFRDDLREQGMLGEAKKMMMASGKLQALCYKMEIERSLRTPNLSGFQLLGLQDFPGQGTALVGVLNAFYGEKGYISKKEFNRFCNSTVPLLKLSKFTWMNHETLTAEALLFHYGKKDLIQPKMKWEMLDPSGKVMQQGVFEPQLVPIGSTTAIDRLTIELGNISKAGQFTIRLQVMGTNWMNEWPVWVYPSLLPSTATEEVYTTDTLDEKTEKILSSGGKVLLLLNGKVKKGREVIQAFTPVFWNTSWFKMRPPHTLGLLMDPVHPVWKNFPTEYHSNLQWWELANGAQVMHLEKLPPDLQPLIRSIDTWFMNRRLAMLFEVKVNGGQLMVCSADISSNLERRPVARQLAYSIRKYMTGNDFKPQLSVTVNQIRELVTHESAFIFDAFTRGTPDELKPVKQ